MNHLQGNILNKRGDNRHNLKSLRLPNIVRVIKSTRLRWAGHVARIEAGRSTFKILTGTPKGKRPLESLDVDGKTILERILKE